MCAEICQLPAETGPCRAAKLRFFYDVSSGSCRQFTYGGCNGNANRFLTVDNCRRVCEYRNVSEPTSSRPPPPQETVSTTLVDSPTHPVTRRPTTTAVPATTQRQITTGNTNRWNWYTALQRNRPTQWHMNLGAGWAVAHLTMTLGGHPMYSSHPIFSRIALDNVCAWYCFQVKVVLLLQLFYIHVVSAGPTTLRFVLCSLRKIQSYTRAEQVIMGVVARGVLGS